MDSLAAFRALDETRDSSNSFADQAQLIDSVKCAVAIHTDLYSYVVHSEGTAMFSVIGERIAKFSVCGAANLGTTGCCTKFCIQMWVFCLRAHQCSVP